MEPDFSGYATKAGLKCSDGLTIMPGAFKHQDKMKVPLVWQHGHHSPENILGHALLESRDDGVYAYGFFNESPAAKSAKNALAHKDINMLSIWANELIKRGGQVLHGAIREVSLVLAGANPGAVIESVTIRHSDGEEDLVLDDEAIIYTGEEFETNALAHSEEDDEEDDEEVDDETVKDIYESLSDKQKQVLHYMVGMAAEAADEAKHSNNDNNTLEGTEMTNVFEKGGKSGEQQHVLSHDDMKEIVADATKTGSLREAVEGYALAHGIHDIEILFPEAQTLTNTPDFVKRRTEWVNTVLNGTHKSPFSRIKTIWADLTFEEARAKGYIKGNVKKEEFFSLAKRVTTPQTVYKKQKLDRDDIIDITDFDVVTWMKGEMRVMLDEEIARAVLVGDGREVDDDDKISETNVRPIATDDEFFAPRVYVNLDDANSDYEEVIDALILNRKHYRGSGNPTFFTTENVIGQMLTLKDGYGRRKYRTLNDLAVEMRVAAVVPVEVLEEDAYAHIVGIAVNLNDYNIGADKGGKTTMFDDFDIDYNQYKYLIETRISGALTKPASALVVEKVAGTDTLTEPVAPSFDEDNNEVTITDVTGVVYTDQDDNVLTAAGSPYTVTPGTDFVVTATPASGYYFATSADKEWTFHVHA